MKNITRFCSVAIVAALTMAASSANAENSVILDYDYASAGYFYRDYDTALGNVDGHGVQACLLYTSPSPRDVEESRMPSSA